MGKYTVLRKFTDLQDNNYKYHAGDLYPRDGIEVSAERIKELSTDQNRQGSPLISAIIEAVVEQTVEEVVPMEAEPKAKEQVSKEAAPVPKKEPRKTKTGENPPKTTKAKRSTKKS